MRAIAAAAWAAVRRRRLQSLVIVAVVLLSSATAVLALGLLVASSAPFDRAFADQRGAHATASFDAATVSGADLAATVDQPGVTAAAGPYDATRAQLVVDSPPVVLLPGLIVGRADAASTVDRLEVTDGAWLTGPGQIVLSRELAGVGPTFPSGGAIVGSRITVDVAGQPSLEVVGVADSVTSTAHAWVWPEQTDVLHADADAASRQMLYRFASAGSDEAIQASLDQATAALPEGALAGASTYLAEQLRIEGALAPIVPFVVAFAVLGLVMSVLIVINVVAGAVVAGFRTIGVQKALGFTPGQVVAGYAGQILAVCIPACLLGVVLGRLLAIPLLAQTNEAYTLSGPATIPAWVDLLVLLGVPVMVGLAAVTAAARAGRLSAAQAITVGRAPRASHGFRLRRALSATRLPRPVSFGLGSPSARPARAAVTVVAVLLGATTVVLAAGLAGSLSQVQAAFSRASEVPVTVFLPVSGGPGPRPPGGSVSAPAEPGRSGVPGPRSPGGPEAEPVDPGTVHAAIEAQPGTARLVGMTQLEAGLAGSTEPLEIHAYHGDASWVGYPLISGRWFSGPDEAVAGSRMLRLTGTAVGDHITVSTERGQRRVRVVGEVFSQVGEAQIVMAAAGLADLVESAAPNRFEVGLTGGTEPRDYVEGLSTALGNPAVRAEVTADTVGGESIALMLSLITTLSLGLAAVAALGVFNTVVLNTRERVHEIGVLKSIGMTPRQVRVMVVTSMVTIGALGGALAVPLGWALHRWVVPIMADGAGTGIPDRVLAVYSPLQLIGLGACGVALAVLGALVPAGWAARTRAATALRAE